MTTLQRQRLFDALMEGVPPEEELGRVYREMADAVTEDLDRMEPIIDEMMMSAFRAGKHFSDRKTEADIVLPLRRIARNV